MINFGTIGKVTKRMLAENIIRLANGGNTPSDDDRLSMRQVGLWIDEYRAKLLKEYFEKRKRIDAQYIEDLGCVNLVCDNNDCNTGYKILEKELPKLIDFSSPDMMFSNSTLWVGYSDKVTNIPILSPEQVRYRKHNRYSKQGVVCFRTGNQIYFDLPIGNTLSIVNIRGVFANVTSMDEEYPMPLYHASIMTQLIMKNELNMAITTQPLDDLVNDAKPHEQGKARR